MIVTFNLDRIKKKPTMRTQSTKIQTNEEQITSRPSKRRFFRSESEKENSVNNINPNQIFQKIHQQRQTTLHGHKMSLIQGVRKMILKQMRLAFIR